MNTSTTLLEHVLPQYDVNEIHSIRIRASSEAVYRALQSLCVSDLAVSRFLFWLRRLPALLVAPKRAVMGQWSPRQPMLQALKQAGFVQVAEKPNEEIVIGMVGKFWQPVQNQLKLDDGAAFLRFDDPTCAKAVMNFAIVPISDANVRVTTETRVSVPDQASLRLFRVYWILISFFSGLIRVEMLKQVKRVAERR